MSLKRILAAAVLTGLTACTTQQFDQGQSLGPQQVSLGVMGGSATGCVETATSTCMRTDDGGAHSGPNNFTPRP